MYVTETHGDEDGDDGADGRDGIFSDFSSFFSKTNVKKVCARRRLDGSRCFRFGLRIYNFFGLFPTAKI